jgi:hypothetical protein
MKSALLAFTKNLEDLRYYIQSLEMEAELLSKRVYSADPTEQESVLVQLQNHLFRSTNKRRFDYNSVIVSLYGFLEQYVEELLREYAVAINAIIPTYEELPEKVVKRHIELSYNLITRIEQERYKVVATTKQIIANLHSCMAEKGPYKINAEAFSLHTANFRMGVIEQAFANFGIEKLPIKIKESQAFVDYLFTIDPTRDPNSVTPQEAFFYLEDLADRRNDVAHGVAPDMLLSNKILLDYVTFFEAYGQSLYDAIRRETLPHVIKYQSPILLGSAIAVYNNNIVCVCLNNIAIRVGDMLIAQTPENVYYDGAIEEIQVDNVSLQEVPPSESVNVGMKVPFKAKRNQIFMLLPASRSSTAASSGQRS